MKRFEHSCAVLAFLVMCLTESASAQTVTFTRYTAYNYAYLDEVDFVFYSGYGERSGAAGDEDSETFDSSTVMATLSVSGGDELDIPTVAGYEGSGGWVEGLPDDTATLDVAGTLAGSNDGQSLIDHTAGWSYTCTLYALPDEEGIVYAGNDDFVSGSLDVAVSTMDTVWADIQFSASIQAGDGTDNTISAYGHYLVTIKVYLDSEPSGSQYATISGDLMDGYLSYSANGSPSSGPVSGTMPVSGDTGGSDANASISISGVISVPVTDGCSLSYTVEISRSVSFEDNTAGTDGGIAQSQDSWHFQIDAESSIDHVNCHWWESAPLTRTGRVVDSFQGPVPC